MKKDRESRSSNFGNPERARAWIAMVAITVAGGMGCALSVFAQAPGNRGKAWADDSGSSQTLSQRKSGAARAAEEMVSLSAGTIVIQLRREPGLLLRAKRAMVKKAYEQGRLLDPKDLEDDALFRLIQEDQNIRVLMTHEIESYSRFKQMQQFLARESERSSPGQPVAGSGNRAASQENGHPSGNGSGPRGEGPRDSPDLAGQDLLGRDLSGQGQPDQYLPDQNFPDQNLPDQYLPEQDFSGDGFGGSSRGDRRAPPEGSSDLLRTSDNERSSVQPDRTETMGGGYLSDGYSSGAGALSSRAGVPPGSGLDEARGTRDRFGPEARPRMEGQAGNFRADRELPAEQRGLRHHANPYADVPSLYDLYAQYSGKSRPLERFGLDVFRNGTGNFDRLPMDIPVGPEYVLGPGDGLSINLWGGVSERLDRVVDRQGRVTLPEVGAIEVSGRSLGDAQHLVQSVLRTQFRDVEADVSLARLRTVRVYVVGDVGRAGAYDVSSLSTPLNVVFEAGGPTADGALRILRHYRGKQLVQEVDVYDLLLHGIRSDLKGLQGGDTILVPPLGAEVTLEGMVRRPAIYELGGEKTLAEVLELAGGVLPSGTLRHIDVERVEAHLSRTMLRLDIPSDGEPATVTQALEDFKVQGGDKIKISPILPYADKAVYLEGHVFRPGRFAYRDGMKITDVVKSYSDLLPEPYRRHAEIIRLNPPDYTPAVLAFSLEDALSGKDQDFALQPFDTIRIFGRFDFEDAPIVTVDGEVRDPGEHLTNGATNLRDAIHLAGGTTPDAELTDAQVFRKTAQGRLRVLSVNLGAALGGDEKNNIPLEPKDRVFVHRMLTRADPAAVKIEGDVEQPGRYPLGDAMTAADLVRLAGGFKRGADTEIADLTSYPEEHGANVGGENRTIAIARALGGEADTDVRLHDGDVLTIRELGGWNDVGATIALQGEVLHPGAYGIREGERLSSILARAGGFRSDAYPYGVVFERAQVRKIEESNRKVLIREAKDDGAALQGTPDASAEDKAVKDASLLQWQTTMERLETIAPSGRLVIHISKDVKRWAGTVSDIEVRAGDVMYVPKRPNVVLVDGAVYNPTAVAFRPGKDAGWYLGQSGGPTNMANKKAIFVIRADGSVAGGAGGLFNGGVGSAQLQAGDMVVVPEKAYTGSSKWKNTLQVAQLLQAVALSVSLGKTF